MAQREEIIIRGCFLERRVDLMSHLYRIRGIDSYVSIDDVIISASRRELGDAVRQYTYEKFNTYNIKPLITDYLLRQTMRRPVVQVQFVVEFSSNYELNMYKLKHPNEYNLMKGKE